MFIIRISAFVFVTLPFIGTFIIILCSLINCLNQIKKTEFLAEKAESTENNYEENKKYRKSRRCQEDYKIDKDEVLNTASMTALICFIIWVISFMIVGN